MKLFENFDKVYLVNLKKRHDRLENFDNQVKKYNLGNYSTFEAIDGSKIDHRKYNPFLKPGEIGVLLSNIEIIKDAIKNNFEKILIIEDDCEFSDEIINWNIYLKNIPENWDMIYFGGNHNTHMGIHPPVKINSYAVKLHHTYSAHFVAIKNTLFEIIKKMITEYSEPLDVLYSKIQKKFNCYSTSVVIANQKPGFSDIQNMDLDYQWLIK